MSAWRIIFLFCLILGNIPEAFALRAVVAENRCTGDFCTEVSRARYYNPNFGRFWTMDTYEGAEEEPQSLHKYLYCQANPVNNADPGGHDIGEVLTVGSIMSSFMAFRSPSTARAGVAAAGLGGTAGPDVTAAVYATATDVDRTWFAAGQAAAAAAALGAYPPGESFRDWDTQKTE